MASAATWVLLAEGGAANPLSGIASMAPMLLILMMLYFFIILRPQRREQALRQSMLSEVKKNDHILLNCGIYGVVTNIRPDADEVTIRVDESSNAKLRITRSAIARVITDEPAAKTEAASAGQPGT